MMQFDLTSFGDAEPDFSAPPVKIGKHWVPPGSYVLYDGRKVGRIITTSPSGLVPPSETDGILSSALYVKLNVFDKSDDVEGVPNLTTSTSSGLAHLVQTCTALWIPAGDLKIIVYLFRHNDFK